MCVPEHCDVANSVTCSSPQSKVLGPVHIAPFSVFPRGRCVMVSRCNIKPGILSRIVNRALLMMKFAILVLALVLFTLSPVEGIKACKKIDTCRCLTDEGVINLWSLAGQTPKRARCVCVYEDVLFLNRGWSGVRQKRRHMRFSSTLIWSGTGNTWR